MHMLKNESLDIFVNKTKKVKTILSLKFDCIDLESLPINRQFYKETKILVRENFCKSKRGTKKNEEKQLCGNYLIEFQLWYCPYVFKHLIHCCRKKLIELIYTI